MVFKLLSDRFTHKETNEYAEKFLEVNKESFFFDRYLAEKINSHLHGKLLECCSGISTTYLRYPEKTVSVDINPKMLSNIVSNNIPAVADIQNLPFHNETFDSILISHGLHHVGKDKVHYLECIKPVITELHRILKKGGHLIVVEGIVSQLIHRLIHGTHFVIKKTNEEFYYKYDLPLLYSRRILDKFFPDSLFVHTHREKIRLPVSMYFRSEPMFCFNLRFPLIILPQRPYIHVLQKK